MAETLGTLCDKLTIVKLKQFHSTDNKNIMSLNEQEESLIEEINQFLSDSFEGVIPINKLTFASNKVYKKIGNEVELLHKDIGNIFSKLAEVNCQLWHEQEKVYEFEKVPELEKNKVVKQLAILNLQRNQCIDTIDKQLLDFIINKD